MYAKIALSAASALVGFFCGVPAGVAMTVGAIELTNEKRIALIRHHREVIADFEKILESKPDISSALLISMAERIAQYKLDIAEMEAELVRTQTA